MFTFKDYLSESVLLVEKKVNLSHAEDLIFSKGYEGAKSTLNYLEGVAGMLSGVGETKVNVTTKWDGAPAIFAGNHPENGKFFVGTKGIFTKSNPKILYTNADVDTHYGDKPDLANKLKAALKYLPKLGIRDIIQGDLMFSEGDVKDQTIEGKHYVTFHPNTILYAFPAESKTAEHIKRAKLGIIFHTSYAGDTIHTLKSSYKVDVASLKKTPDVWFDDATYKDASGAVTMTGEETAFVYSRIVDARNALSQISKQDLDLLTANNPFMALVQQFINHRIRQGSQLENIERIPEELSQFIELQVAKDKTKPETKEKKTLRLRAHAKEVGAALMAVFHFQRIVVEVKNILIQKLEAAKHIGTFHVTDKGIEVAPQEGFVAVDHLGDKAIKLVDRLSFSRANFLRHAKGAENEEITAVAGGPPLLPSNSYMGGGTGTQGPAVDPTTGSAHPLGNPTGQFWDSAGTL